MTVRNMTTGFTIHSWKKKLTKGIDTKDLQLLSLNLFLERIGYHLVEAPERHILHITKTDTCYRTNPQYMSLNQAVSIYNGCAKWRKEGEYYVLDGRFIFSIEDFDKAYADKVIKKVYLQRVQGKEGLRVQSNWIMFK